MEIKPDSFEKLGVFYLGREYDLDHGQPRDKLLLYDSKDLLTHAVCVGMTGSGKTGLCISLLEEAIIDHVPAIAIDPKGDLSNLLLTFPRLRGEDFARGSTRARPPGRGIRWPSSPRRRPRSGRRVLPTGGRMGPGSSGYARAGSFASTLPGARPGCRSRSSSRSPPRPRPFATTASARRAGRHHGDQPPGVARG